MPLTTRHALLEARCEAIVAATRINALAAVSEHGMKRTAALLQVARTLAAGDDFLAALLAEQIVDAHHHIARIKAQMFIPQAAIARRF